MDLTTVRELGRHPRREWQSRLHPLAVVIAPYFTWAFVNLGLSANGVTWLWGVLGVLAALLIATGIPVLVVLGAGVFGLSITLDLVDGQVARINRSGGPKGRYLDRMFHHIVYPLIASAMAIATMRPESSAWLMPLGFVFVVAVSVSVAQTDVAHVLVRDSGERDTDESVGGRSSHDPAASALARIVGPRAMVWSFSFASVVHASVLGLGLQEWVVVLFCFQFVAVTAIRARHVLRYGTRLRR